MDVDVDVDVDERVRQWSEAAPTAVHRHSASFAAVRRRQPRFAPSPPTRIDLPKKRNTGRYRRSPPLRAGNRRPRRFTARPEGTRAEGAEKAGGAPDDASWTWTWTWTWTRGSGNGRRRRQPRFIDTQPPSPTFTALNIASHHLRRHGSTSRKKRNTGRYRRYRPSRTASSSTTSPSSSSSSSSILNCRGRARARARARTGRAATGTGINRRLSTFALLHRGQPGSTGADRGQPTPTHPPEKTNGACYVHGTQVSEGSACRPRGGGASPADLDVGEAVLCGRVFCRMGYRTAWPEPPRTAMTPRAPSEAKRRSTAISAQAETDVQRCRRQLGSVGGEPRPATEHKSGGQPGGRARRGTGAPRLSAKRYRVVGPSGCRTSLRVTSVTAWATWRSRPPGGPGCTGVLLLSPPARSTEARAAQLADAAGQSTRLQSPTSRWWLTVIAAALGFRRRELHHGSWSIYACSARGLGRRSWTVLAQVADPMLQERTDALGHCECRSESGLDELQILRIPNTPSAREWRRHREHSPPRPERAV